LNRIKKPAPRGHFKIKADQVMGDDLKLLEQQPAASEQRHLSRNGSESEPKRLTHQKRRPKLSPSETAAIRELAARGESSSAIARQLVDRPVRTVRNAMRAMSLAKPPPREQPSVTPPPSQLANGSTPKSKSYTPITEADRVRIGNLVAAGLSTAAIAAKVRRGVPQVSRIVRELAASTKPPTSVSVPVLMADSKVSCPAKTWAALAAAARRRSVEPAHLAVMIIDGVLRRGSIDAAIHADAEHVSADGRDLRVQVVLDLEAVGSTGPRACRDYRLRGVALAYGERAG
jgi:hypothetical protein